MSYDTTQDDRLLAMLAYLLSFPFPFLAPLVLYLVKKDQSRFVAFHALQCLFLHVAMVIISGVAGILCAILGALGPLALLTFLIIPLVGLVGLAAVVFTLVAGIKAYGGEWYKIPFLGDFVPVREAL